MAPPHLLLDRLEELARQERRLRLVWGLSRCAAVIAAMFLFCCGIDWLVDIWYDTPALLRWMMRMGQLAVAGIVLWNWVIVPVRSGLDPEAVAKWVETKDPSYGHRLVSAVQLNAGGANREGMSESLIDAVTQQAEEIARMTDFSTQLDKRRWKWSVMLAAPTVLVMLVLFLCWNATLPVLSGRQFGSDERIPRSKVFAPLRDELMPSGEPVTLQFEVAGDISPEQAGVVEIVPEGQSREKYPLRFHSETYGGGRFTAVIPASSTPFTYRAWLFDSRTHQEGHVTFAPRPTLTAWEAWLLLPRYVGVRADNKPFELHQPKGDLKPVPGCSARINVTTQTPIVEAYVELLGPMIPDLACRLTAPIGPVSPAYLLEAQRQIGWTATGAGPLVLLGKVPLQLSADGLGASTVMSLPLGTTAYRVIVTDRHGLSNRPVPRRAISFHRDGLPQVTLLPERFSAPGEGTEEADLEGMPIPLNRPVRIGYLVKDDLVLDKMTLRYRINEGPWEQLPLTEVMAPGQGKLDIRTGAFDVSGAKEQVGFYAQPPADAAREPGRGQGGGRFDFQTRALPGLKVGDVVEYYLEARDRHDDADRLPGRSVVRRKTVVTEAAFVEWLVHTVQQENRLRQVEKQQKKVFEPR